MVLGLALLACAAPRSRSEEVSESIPAASTAQSGPGLENTWLVTPALYRGAQPLADGFGELHRLGVKTVVNLRQFHSDRDELADAQLDRKLGYEHIRFATWSPKRKHVLRFLKIAIDPDRQPVFVHCMHGSDRTGTMIAAYRIVVQGWSKDAAIEEMCAGGFGYHSIWTGLPAFLRELDREEMRADLGLSSMSIAPPSPPVQRSESSSSR